MPQLPGFGPDDPFSQFFRGFPEPRGSVPVHGEGSGFIIKPDGTILTNAHVVADATKVTVKLTDRREFEAKVLGVDEKTDVAVLKIDAKDLPVVHLGQRDNVQVGEWVVAIGAPFGFDNSVTAGIVSAKGRTLPDGSYVPFLQTDVAINPGNSGGPLFNLDGDVIGINSQIYSRSGGYRRRVVRDPDRRRAGREPAAAGERQRLARQARRRHPGGRPEARRLVRARYAARRARLVGRARRVRRPRPGSRPAT